MKLCCMANPLCQSEFASQLRQLGGKQGGWVPSKG